MIADAEKPPAYVVLDDGTVVYTVLTTTRVLTFPCTLAELRDFVAGGITQRAPGDG